MKTLLFWCALLCTSLTANAGPGHDHGEGAFAQNAGPAMEFELTDQQMINLGVKSSPVKSLPLSQTVSMLAFTELLPERRASISSHFEGTLTELKAQTGEVVKKNQHVASVKPNRVGSKSIDFYSPIDGFVLETNAEIGQILSSGSSILQLGDPRQMLLRGVAYETPELTLLQVGQRVEVHLDIAPDRHIEGRIQRINRVIDPDTRTFSVYALIDTPLGDIKPGLQGTIEIFTEDESKVLAVPKRSVLGELGNYFVYVINGKHVTRRSVTVGTKTSHHTEILSGLKIGERVVVQGNYQFQFIAASDVKHADDHNHSDHHHH